jgi:hypothetical protein
MYKQLFLTGILCTLLTSVGPVFAHDGADHQFRDQKHQVHDAANAGVISPQQHQVLDSQRNMQHTAVDNGYAAPGAYQNGAFPAYTNNSYTNQGYGLPVQPVQGYGAGHINNPAINPGHNNSIGHQMGDALNGNQSSNPGYGYGVNQGYGVPVQGYGAGHINNPAINPGHNNSIGHRMGDAMNGSQAVTPGYGYGVSPSYGGPAMNGVNPNYAYHDDSSNSHPHNH